MPVIKADKLIHHGWGKFHVLTVEGDERQSYTRQVEDHGAAVGVLPYDPVRRVVTLVRQWRAPIAWACGTGEILEIPAGMLDEDATPDECARREGLEEAGLKFHELEFVAKAWTGPGFTTECISLYLGLYRDVDRVSLGGGINEEHEYIEVVEIAYDRAADMMRSGEISDLKTLYLLQCLQLRGSLNRGG